MVNPDDYNNLLETIKNVQPLVSIITPELQVHLDGIPPWMTPAIICIVPAVGDAYNVVVAVERMEEIFGDKVYAMELAEPMIVRYGRHHIGYQDVLGVAKVYRLWQHR